MFAKQSGRKSKGKPSLGGDHCSCLFIFIASLSVLYLIFPSFQRSALKVFKESTTLK